MLKSSFHPLTQAFISLCDLLVVCSTNLAKHGNRYVRMMVYPPSEIQKEILVDFVKSFVFSKGYEESQDETKIEELHKKRSYLAAYCKLVVYNILPISAASEIFKFYIKFYNDYGDIIKATLAKTREINKINCTMTMLLSIRSLFEDIHASQGRISRSSQEFSDLKELAKRFALSFGLDAVKNREAVTALHRAGILFASLHINLDDPTPPQNLLFLEILSEFTNKLLKQDKKPV